MAEADFQVSYEGPALEAGRMAVRDLAPALLALGNIFTDAGATIYPDRQPPIALNIEATAEGSFLIRLVLESEEIWDQAIDLLRSPAAEGLANLVGLVIGTKGLIWAMKLIGGRQVESSDHQAEPGHVRMTLQDGTALDVEADVFVLYQRIEIRRKIREVVAPLATPGIERIEFAGDAEKIVIEEKDLPAYEVPEDEGDTLLDQEREMVVEIVSVAFAEGNKWRFTDGQQTFYAAIEDEAFLQRVEDGTEAFRKGDLLRSRMRILQVRARDGRLHTEYFVTEVVEHIPPALQLGMDAG